MADMKPPPSPPERSPERSPKSPPALPEPQRQQAWREQRRERVGACELPAAAAKPKTTERNKS
jgi:hypothetical protein